MAVMWELGVVLSQEGDGGEGVVAYYSHVLSRSEQTTVSRRELLAVVVALHHFRPCLSVLTPVHISRFPDLATQHQGARGP